MVCVRLVIANYIDLFTSLTKNSGIKAWRDKFIVATLTTLGMSYDVDVKGVGEWQSWSSNSILTSAVDIGGVQARQGPSASFVVKFNL